MKGKNKYLLAQQILRNLYEKIYVLEGQVYSEEELYFKYLKLLRESAYLGYPEAQYDLALHYESRGFWGMYNLYYSPKKCIYWYTKAGEQNFPEALNNLATYYELGIEVEQDSNKALDLYRKAGELGDEYGWKNYKKYKRKLKSEELLKPLIQFHPFEGLGEIKFSFRKEDIINILGKPNKIEKIDDEEPGEYSMHLSYKKWKMDVYVNYVNGIFDQTTFHVEDLILEDIQFSKQSRKKVLEFIKTYHSIHHIPYNRIYKYDAEVKDHEYCFKNLGLKLWFENDKIVEIFVCRRIEDDWL